MQLLACFSVTSSIGSPFLALITSSTTLLNSGKLPAVSFEKISLLFKVISKELRRPTLPVTTASGTSRNIILRSSSKRDS